MTKPLYPEETGQGKGLLDADFPIDGIGLFCHSCFFAVNHSGGSSRS
jgi:hypothetical protein